MDPLNHPEIRNIIRKDSSKNEIPSLVSVMSIAAELVVGSVFDCYIHRLSFSYEGCHVLAK